MEIWVFGNPDLPQDAVPLQLLPRLRTRFPQHRFRTLDPNEEWDMPDPLLIIDTVAGVSEVRAFTDLSAFTDTHSVTMHDFDLGTKLRWMQKIRKLPKDLTIVGVPMGADPERAYRELTATLDRY